MWLSLAAIVATLGATASVIAGAGPAQAAARATGATSATRRDR